LNIAATFLISSYTPLGSFISLLARLVVKVAGYSAQFVLLDKKLQDQIMVRTEHAFK